MGVDLSGLNVRQNKIEKGILMAMLDNVLNLIIPDVERQYGG